VDWNAPKDAPSAVAEASATSTVPAAANSTEERGPSKSSIGALGLPGAQRIREQDSWSAIDAKTHARPIEVSFPSNDSRFQHRRSNGSNNSTSRGRLRDLIDSNRGQSLPPLPPDPARTAALFPPPAKPGGILKKSSKYTTPVVPVAAVVRGTAAGGEAGAERRASQASSSTSRPEEGKVSSADHIDGESLSRDELNYRHGGILEVKGVLNPVLPPSSGRRRSSSSASRTTAPSNASSNASFSSTASSGTARFRYVERGWASEQSTPRHNNVAVANRTPRAKSASASRIDTGGAGTASKRGGSFSSGSAGSFDRGAGFNGSNHPSSKVVSESPAARPRLVRRGASYKARPLSAWSASEQAGKGQSQQGHLHGPNTTSTSGATVGHERNHNANVPLSRPVVRHTRNGGAPSPLRRPVPNASSASSAGGLAQSNADRDAKLAPWLPAPRNTRAVAASSRSAGYASKKAAPKNPTRGGGGGRERSPVPGGTRGL